VGAQNQPGTGDARNAGPELRAEGDPGAEEGDPPDGVAARRHPQETGKRDPGDGKGGLQARNHTVEVH